MPAFTKIPTWLQVYNKDICWRIDDMSNNIYLTFDDGPHPIATPVVLDILKEHGIKACFFCIGANVLLYPEIFNRILMDGHFIGNHSYSHRNGWKLPVEEYVDDVNMAAEFIHSKLFRPPFGRITPLQIKVLRGKYKIIMWDVLSKDYDEDLSNQEIISNVVDNISGGSIIVMHDNEKTANRIGDILKSMLPKLREDWNFKTIPQS